MLQCLTTPRLKNWMKGLNNAPDLFSSLKLDSYSAEQSSPLHDKVQRGKSASWAECTSAKSLARCVICPRYLHRFIYFLKNPISYKTSKNSKTNDLRRHLEPITTAMHSTFSHGRKWWKTFGEDDVDDDSVQHVYFRKTQWRYSPATEPTESSLGTELFSQYFGKAWARDAWS